MLYEHDERTFRAVTEVLQWTEVPVQLRERDLEPVKEQRCEQFVGHNTQGAALYQNEKGVRYKFDGEVGWNEPVKIAYTAAGVQGEIDRRDHPEYMTIEEIVAQDQQEHRAAPAAPAAPAPPPAEPPQPTTLPPALPSNARLPSATGAGNRSTRDFFLDLIAKTDHRGQPVPVLWASAPDVLPSIHAWRPADGDEHHLGFGCFRIQQRRL